MRKTLTPLRAMNYDNLNCCDVPWVIYSFERCLPTSLFYYRKSRWCGSNLLGLHLIDYVSNGIPFKNVQSVECVRRFEFATENFKVAESISSNLKRLKGLLILETNSQSY